MAVGGDGMAAARLCLAGLAAPRLTLPAARTRATAAARDSRPPPLRPRARARSAHERISIAARCGHRCRFDGLSAHSSNMITCEPFAPLS
eukprot:5685421-Prymnesium_polylepis.1